MSAAPKKTAKQGAEKPKRPATTGSWKPGCPSPNPKGRPPTGTSFAEKVRAFLAENDEQGKEPRAEVMLRCLYELALGGSIQAHRLLFERGYGVMKPVEAEEPEEETAEGAYLVYLRKHPKEREKYLAYLEGAA